MTTKQKEGENEEATLPENVEEAESSAQPSLEELQTQVETLKGDLKSSKEESLKHQQNVTKKSDELSKKETAEKKIGGMENRLEVLTDMVADLVDSREDSEEESKPKRRSEEYLARIKPQESLEQALNQKGREADRLAKSAGLDVTTSPELKDAYIRWLEGDGDGLVEEVKRVVDTKQSGAEEKEKPEELTSEDKGRIAREWMKEEGLTTQDTGGSSGGISGIPTDMTQFRTWIAGISQEDYEEKYASDVNKMMKEGKIK